MRNGKLVKIYRDSDNYLNIFNFCENIRSHQFGDGIFNSFNFGDKI